MLPKRILNSLLLAASLTACSLERPDRTFVNWGAVVWRGEIRLDENFYVSENDILVIEPGTIVRFTATNVDLLVEGGFVCEGTVSEPVHFVNDGPAVNSVILFGVDNPQNSITWTSFGENTLDLRTFCAVGNSRIGRILILNPNLGARPVFRDCLVGYAEARISSSSVFSACRFDRASFPSLSSGEKNLSVFDASSVAATNCEFLGSSSLASPPAGWTVEVTASALLRKNWWGTNSSTYVTNTLLFRSIPAQTIYLPALTSPRATPSVP